MAVKAGFHAHTSGRISQNMHFGTLHSSYDLLYIILGVFSLVVGG